MFDLGLSAKGWRCLLAAFLSMASYYMYFLVMMFYVPFQNTFGLSNTQISALMTVYTLAGMPCYVLAGRASDVLSPKLCMCLSCFAVGLVGLALSTVPPFGVLVLLFLLLPLGEISWASCIKCMRMLVPDPAKLGRVFGLANAADGVMASALFLSFVLILGERISQPAYYRAALAVFGCVELLCGAVIFFMVDYKWILSQAVIVKADISSSLLGSLKAVLRIPELWAVGFISMVYYGMTTLVNYISPYLVNCYGFPVAMSTLFAIITRFTLKSMAGLAGGALRDRFGAVYKSIRLTSIFTIIGFIGLILLPYGSSRLVPACAIAAVVIFTYGMNCTAGSLTLGEYDPPSNIYGTMTGLTSIIGSLGTIIVSNISGPVLDRMGNPGYRYVFALGIAVELIFVFSKKIIDWPKGRPNSISKDQG
ncbi:MAG: MFS transporter [Firmicutes bacterium]|nr:MFS transporter [Bacillota bacterium]